MAKNEVTAATRPTCFVIMPISDSHGYEPGHFGRVYEHLLKPAILDAGFTPVRADDTNKTDYIVVGIIRKMVESEMVLCDFSARNPNVMYELGVRHAFNKPVVLIKDKKTEKVFDIQGLRFTEYDESLRIDSVQKDIARISAALKETMNAEADSLNSIVQLAGLTAAEVPEAQTISKDTQLLMSAMASLEKRIDGIDGPSKGGSRFFKIDGSYVNFSDGTHATIGDEVYDGGRLAGTLVDIHPDEERIFVRQPEGKIVPYAANSIKSKALSEIPF